MGDGLLGGNGAGDSGGGVVRDGVGAASNMGPDTVAVAMVGMSVQSQSSLMLFKVGEYSSTLIASKTSLSFKIRRYTGLTEPAAKAVKWPVVAVVSGSFGGVAGVFGAFWRCVKHGARHGGGSDFGEGSIVAEFIDVVEVGAILLDVDCERNLIVF